MRKSYIGKQGSIHIEFENKILQFCLPLKRQSCSIYSLNSSFDQFSVYLQRGTYIADLLSFRILMY